MLKSADIKKLVLEAGFDLCGITRAEPLPQGERNFCEWLSAGYGDGLDYLHNNLDLRFDPSQLIPNGASVIVCAVNYKSVTSLESGRSVATYALMRDYHKTIKKMMKGVLKALLESDTELSGRLFTDSAPLLEKHLAMRAGLGWIGRQSLLITPQFGSFVLLGEILIDREVDIYDNPFEGKNCGDCSRCVDVCPAKAINHNRTIDTRRCISCRTVERVDIGTVPLGGWVFGCDSCQICCPHNRSTPIATNPHMQPIISPLNREEWMSMSDVEFREFVQGTPIKRSSLERIKECIERG